MRSTAATFILIGLISVPLGAQGRGGRNGAQGIPPGQLPPRDACRVWYDNRPPGRQPAPTSCREAERVAARDNNARVIYGANSQRLPPYPGRYPTGRGVYNTRTVPFDNGYTDGYEKGREDARDRDSYDPVRHSRYRSADHGYNQRYGSKESYKLVYRDGFEAGYDNGYRQAGVNNPERRRSGSLWPF